MSARMFYLPRPTFPEPGEIMASLVCWGAYILLLSCYCTLYQVIVDSAAPDFIGSFMVRGGQHPGTPRLEEKAA